ncbi:MAG: hypothetical protein HOO91_02175 [Bacteroidales bacterium]|nr:hypothetical protein [Bacteroidales bacterium]
MKLTKRYIADDYALSENSFWSKHIQDFFFNILSITPTIDEKYLKYSDSFHYTLNTKEIEYYQNSYIHIGIIINRDENSTVYDYFNDTELVICTREKDLLDYLMKIDSKLLIILGKVGWGKTTLLQYFFFYLIQKSEKLTKNIYPIFISLHREINEQINQKGETFSIKSFFYEKLLVPRLKKICEEIIDIENDKFWDYIVDFPDCVDYKREVGNYSKIFKDNPLLAHKNILQLRATYQKIISDILFYALKYLSNELHKTPVIIIDDADRIDIQWNKDILEELHKLSHKYDFKVIFAARPSTFHGVFKNDNHLMEIISPTIMDLKKPILELYINSRKQRILQFKNENTGIVIKYDDNQIDKSKAIEFYIKMTELIEKNENFSFISNISSGDIRNLGRLLRKYYSTGFVNYNNIFLRFVNESITVLPDWLLFISIITNNYHTYFGGNRESERSEEFIINLFASRNHTITSLFMKIQILSYLIINESVDLRLFRNEYINLFKKEHKPSIFRSFNNSILSLINYRIINTEEFFSIDNEQSLEKIKEISIEPTGRYYFENLLSNFEYLSYMKDDIDYDIDVTISDCINTRGFIERYKSIIAFIDYLFKKESEMINGFTRIGYEKYRNEFIIKSNPISFTQFIAEKILLIAKEKVKNLKGDSKNTSELLTRNNTLENKINAIKSFFELSVVNSQK